MTVKTPEDFIFDSLAGAAASLSDEEVEAECLEDGEALSESAARVRGAVLNVVDELAPKPTHATILREDLIRLGDVLDSEMVIRHYRIVDMTDVDDIARARVRWAEDMAILRRIEVALEIT